MCIGNKEIYGIFKACWIKCVLLFTKCPFKILTFSHQILLFHFINQELYEMYWTNVTRVIESRRIRRTEHVARTGNLRKRDHLEDLGVDRRRVLKWGGHRLDLSGSGQGQAAGCCECGSEPSDSIKCGNFLTSWGPISFSGRTLRREVRYLVFYKSRANI